MRMKGGVPARASQQKTQIAGKKMQEISFEAMSHDLVNVKEKLKKKGTPPTWRAADSLLGPKRLTSQRTRTIRANTGSLSRRNADQTMKTTCPNLAAAAKTKRWAMPTWCHMFNSTLIGSARVWFDKLPSESINNYEVLWKALLGNFSEQKNYIKDPVEIHHIKQREGESKEAFMERFKAENMHVNGAPECM
ncbi:reverse transcriptase domain-containing protein [Tanacetum coccineum]